jgi:hypothetical protein
MGMPHDVSGSFVSEKRRAAQCSPFKNNFEEVLETFL